jgi:hypothetical protein
VIASFAIRDQFGEDRNFWTDWAFTTRNGVTHSFGVVAVTATEMDRALRGRFCMRFCT